MNFAKGVLGDARVKSKEQAADGTASDDNTMDKLSTNVESEHHNVPEPQEKSSPETEQTSDQYLSLKKKQKAAGPLGPDQMKKELYKKLDSNMDWIKKRLAKDMENTKAQKPPTKVFYKDAVYEVDANQTKTDGDMKQVYRDLKESFNLLYPTDMSDFNHRLRKHAGQAIFQETNGGEDFRFGKTSMRDFAPNGPRKELITPKQKSMMDSKRTFEVGGSPPKTEKKSESKPPNERLHTVSNQSKTPKPSTDLKAAKPIIDSPSSDKLLINTKLTNQKASYSSNEVKPFNDKTGLSSSVARKNQNKNKSDKNQLTVLKTLTEVPKSKPETVRTQEDGEALEQRQIPLIHRSFSNYYMKNFMRTGARLFTKQTQPSDQEEVATKKAEKFNRSHSSKPERVGGSRSASQSHDAHSHHTSLCLESFYKVLLEPQELVKPMSQWLKLFVADMIKTMQDFTNRFPHGAAPPERTVNLPAKDKKKKYTVIFDLDETLVHCSFDLTKEGPRMTFGKGSSSAQAILYVRPHARELLKDLAEDFEVLVFTSSNKEYAREVVKRLDPKMQSISFLLHRDHCNIRNNAAIKDLRIIKNRNIETMLIVDNCVGSFGNQLANGVPILPFDGDKNDRELVHLGKIIRKLVARDNLVQDNSRLFGLSTIRFCKEPRNYLEELVARLGKDFPEFKSV